MDELERKIAFNLKVSRETRKVSNWLPSSANLETIMETYHGDVFIERPVHCSELQLARKANVAKRIVNICKQQPVEQGQVVYLR